MNEDTPLYRQVNSAWEQRGMVTSQAFTPTHKDNKRLSVYAGNMISPEDAWRHYNRQYASIGVMAVTVSECGAEDLAVRLDPREFREHAVVDFSGLTNNKIRRKARNLSDAANIRGWCFRPDPVT